MFRKIKKLVENIPQYLKVTFIFFICNFMQKAVSIITTPIFTRILSTEEYGKYSVFAAWLNIGLVICVWELYGSAYSKGLIKFEKCKNEYAASMQKLVFFLLMFWGVVCHLFSNGLRKVIPSLNEIELMMMLGIIWTTCIFNLWATKQRVELRYRALLMITTLTCLLEPIFSIALVINSPNKVDARIFARLVVELVLYLPLCITQIIKGRHRTKKEYWIYAFKMNIPLIPHYLSTVILSMSDRIMISELINESKAGIYSLAYSVSSISLLVNAALIQVLQPWLFKKMKMKKWNEIGKITYICLLLVFLINNMYILIVPEVIYIFAAKEYYEAIYVMPPIIMSVFFMFMYTLFSSVEFYFEKTSYISIATLSGAILNISLNFYFIKKVGYYAAGYTTLACYMFFCIMHYLFMRKILKKNKIGAIYDIKFLIVLSVVFVCLGFFLMFVFENIVMRYIILVGIAAALLIHRKKLKVIFKEINQDKGIQDEIT